MGKYLSYFDKFKGMEPYLCVDEKEWRYIRDTFDKEDVKESLAEIAMTYPLPYRVITPEEAVKEFRQLKALRCYDYLEKGEWIAREGDVSYNHSLLFDGEIQKYIRQTPVGNSASDYFHQENRWKVNHHCHPGPENTWNDKKKMITLMGATYTMNYDILDRRHIRNLISVRKYICSQFKPSVAKIVYDLFRSENILDFSAGWGDRLAGFYASYYGKFYLGIDPNSNNHPLYEQQTKFYEKYLNYFDNKRTAKFICQPAEDYDYAGYENFFDMCFTSPPYFNKERYSDEGTQSWKRYKTMNTWNEDFLHVTLEKVWKTLKTDGVLLVNISDVYTSDKTSSYKKKWMEICNPMNNFLSTLPNAEYIGCLGMRMTKRPNNMNLDLDTIFGEPIWIWKKKGVTL